MAERVLWIGRCGLSALGRNRICDNESTACPYPGHDRNAVGLAPSEVIDPRPAASARFSSIARRARPDQLRRGTGGRRQLAIDERSRGAGTLARASVTSPHRRCTPWNVVPRIERVAWPRNTNVTVRGMTKVLLTGMSGTGKSSALAKLGRRGYRVVDTDEPGWTEWVASSEEVGGGERLWVEGRMTELLGSDEGRTLFVQGCVRNQVKFYDRFDAVVLLSAPVEVMLDRIADRTTNPFGKTRAERELILQDLATVEPLLRAGCSHELDASRPLDEVVDDLIAIAGAP
jgi:shikimate kinase